MTEYHDGMRVEKEKNSAIPSTEAGDGLKPYQEAHLIDAVNALRRLLRMRRPCTCGGSLCAWCDAQHALSSLSIQLDGSVWTQFDAMRTTLREALKSVDDDPERYEVYGWCNECTQGSTPHSKDKGLCWIHKARKLIGDKDYEGK